MRTISKTIHLSYLSCTKCVIMIKTQRGNQMTTIMNLMTKTHREKSDDKHNQSAPDLFESSLQGKKIVKNHKSNI